MKTMYVVRSLEWNTSYYAVP